MDLHFHKIKSDTNVPPRQRLIRMQLILLFVFKYAKQKALVLVRIITPILGSQHERNSGDPEEEDNDLECQAKKCANG